METLKGRKAEVLRSKFASTNNGVSDKFDEFIVVGEGIAKYEEGNEENTNVLKIVKRVLFGKEYLHAEPINKPNGLVGPMFGGNFINCTGSMFNDISYPIKIHDRFEGKEEYLSHD